MLSVAVDNGIGRTGGRGKVCHRSQDPFRSGLTESVLIVPHASVGLDPIASSSIR